MRRSRAAAVLLVVVSAGIASADWPTYAGGPHRLFFNARPGKLTAANVGHLQVKWTFHTGGPVTASPSIVTLRVPGEGQVPVAFVPSWDHNLYAIRVRD
jgi:glucose dehydrogenase